MPDGVNNLRRVPGACHPAGMRGTRLGLTVVAVVVGVVAVIVGNWWTATAMVLVTISQVLAARQAERQARRGSADGTCSEH